MSPLSKLGRLVPPAIRAAAMRFSVPGQEEFDCPICGYAGPFRTMPGELPRQHAQCLGCGALERHRLMWLSIHLLGKTHPLNQMRALHFAPERCLRQPLAKLFRSYETADMGGQNVDHKVDMCALPFPDASFDAVIASHVLHHIRDEGTALQNLWRVLKPGGIAIIPVPIFSEQTVEYPESIETQMRAPGTDYFDRCRKLFASVQLYSSNDFERRYQAWVYEDRRRWPSQWSLRPVSEAGRHIEYVPIAYR